ncbi:MAG: hypothetical protein WBF17_13355 [Phycisphaerae bacterium]
MDCRKGRTAGRLVLAAACLVSGCRHSFEEPSPPIGYIGSWEGITRLRRVVVVELGASDECEPGVARDMTRSLASALQARRLFHVDLVHRTDPVCRDLSINQMGALSLDEIARMRDALQCDAVLIGRISHFQPFPRMQLGLVVKLMDVRDGELLWGIEHVWDTTDRETERRIQRYFHREVRSGYDPLGYELVLKSPRAFERFIAHEVANSLRSRELPSAGRAGPSRSSGRAVSGRLRKKAADTGETTLSGWRNVRL